MGQDPGPIFRSSDSGLTWTQTSAPIGMWTSVASSADGTKLVAAIGSYFVNGYNSTLYISTNSGTTWVENTDIPESPASIVSVACSADGRVILANGGWAVGEAYGSALFISTNAGVDWTVTNFYGVANSVSCSADGTKIIAGFGFMSMWTMLSTNLGSTWRQSIGGQSVASSADGTILLNSSGYGGPGPIWLSSNAGISWSQITNPPITGTAVACSAEGKRLLSATGGYTSGTIFASGDSGVTWLQSDAPTTNWSSVVTSADGNKMFAAAQGWPSGALVYTAQSVPAPCLSISPAGPTRVVSWLVPSMDFVLQQTSSLEAPAWTEVDIVPTLNFTNLHYEITIPATSDSAFYRLASKK